MTKEHHFPIVAVGASAGGLEAFTQLLQHLPADSGMAFVLIQHLDPKHASFLSAALAKATTMIVTEADDGTVVEPNHVYTIPPSADIALHHGKLALLPRTGDGGKPHLPIDFFFRSLAVERGTGAIGVVLSGTASDGTEGLKAINDEDGITFAQDPKTAKFDGMPRSAIDAGVVDYCLSIPALAEELARLSRHPYTLSPKPTPQSADNVLDKIFVVLRNVVGVDFSEYKSPTFERRLARRMALCRVESTKEYLLLLQRDEHEARTLHEELLIHVTSFFRDEHVFEALKNGVFPELMKHKPVDGPIRIWVAGCSTGEEVYSLAIALLEFLGDAYRSHPIQIFGSDVSDRTIEKARAGCYSESAMRDVSDERRRRYFSRVENGYRINKTVRDLCLFVRHDLARDPPFSKIDLVSCRNVLIYFDQELQKRILPTFHYCLNQPGFLLLGRTENISSFAPLFSVSNKAHKIFSRSASPSVLHFAPRTEVHPSKVGGGQHVFVDQPRRALDLAKHFDRLLSATYAPPGVLVNDKMEILQFRGQTGSYLQPAPGVAENNLLKMARGGLLSALRETMARAKKKKGLVRKSGVHVDDNGFARTCDVVIRPFTELPDLKDKLFVVLFEQVSTTPKKTKVARGKSVAKETRRVDTLEQELAATKEYLFALTEEHDRTTDDLGATNEELVSGNEELQSLNEELETAKEELQSANEELTTVNDELHRQNHEVSQVNSDLVNLLATVDIPILILDGARRIRRFTPKARSILNVVAADVGRPFDDIKPNIDVPDIEEQIAEVIDTLAMKETEVQDRSGRWHRMQIRPYKTVENKIDGVILSLVDIDSLKHNVYDAQAAKGEAEHANVAKDQFLATLSHELRTPLSSMMLNAQRLLQPGLDGVKIQKTSEAVERGVRTMVQLIDDLLDVSRIVTGKLKMELHSVDLRDVVSASVEGIAGHAQAKSIDLKLEMDASPAIITGDEGRLQQVVSNLLTNSMKFTPKGGQVSVVLSRAEDVVELRVTDNGIGIEQEFLPRVFGRFSQADSSNTRHTGGLGLGLAISHHILEQHGGSIRAESPGLGQGSTFVVTLPLITRTTLADAATAAVAAEKPVTTGRLSKVNRDGLRHLRVVVVDDDRATREVIGEMLTDRGAEVRLAESASEAMTLIDIFKPEVLVSDIAMPNDDGYRLIRRVRGRGAARGGKVPALALTALAGEEDRQRALAAGFQMHMAKPIDINRLTNAILALADSSPARVRDDARAN